MTNVLDVLPRGASDHLVRQAMAGFLARYREPTRSGYTYDIKTSGPVLLCRAGTRMDRFAATRIVKRLCKTVGIDKRISPHSLRHSCITAALDANVPMRDVQILARHADPRTTMRYDRARENLDRHASYIVTAFVAGGA